MFVKKSLIWALILLGLISSVYAVNPALDVRLVISEDSQILEDAVYVTFGKESSYYTEGEYTLLITDVDGKTIFSASYDLEFFLLADPPRRIGSAVFEQKIPYTTEMYKLQFLKNNEALYTKFLDFCNYNTECDSEENYLSCPNDCPLTQKDGVCISQKEGICDPDCLAGADVDCKKPRDKLTISLILLAAILIFVLLFWNKIKLRSSTLKKLLLQRHHLTNYKEKLKTIKTKYAIIRKKIKELSPTVTERFK
ncbi:hypothetical protein HY643_00505 [Candidatus Woesearchaeota archaeon]|nr:hypothetical protein [Candidatus Woesearchaeota archaeon]